MSHSWQRPQSPQYTRFCAVIRYEGGASIAACGGRWATSSTHVLIGVDVGKLECPACRDALAAPHEHRWSAQVGTVAAPVRFCEICKTEVHAFTYQPLPSVEAGLSELRNAPAIRTAELHTAPRDGVLFTFDMSEDES